MNQKDKDNTEQEVDLKSKNKKFKIEVLISLTSLNVSGWSSQKAAAHKYCLL